MKEIYTIVVWGYGRVIVTNRQTLVKLYKRRKKGRPSKWWSDYIAIVAVNSCPRLARDREKCKELKEVYNTLGGPYIY